MDAWWQRLVEAQFQPVIGRTLFDRILDVLDLDDEANANGTHVGSAYIAGWNSHVEKDLRALLGKPVSPAAVATVLRGRRPGTLPRAAGAHVRGGGDASYEQVYGDDQVCSPENQRYDKQWCFDAIRHTSAGVILQPLIHWQYRPTFQQAVEVGGIIGAGGDMSRVATARRATT
jgi:hypothetical protein